jgi:hypothetical protein
MACCGESHDKKVQLALDLFEKIGKKSLLLINKNRNEKNKTWEDAIEINYIAHKGYNILKNSERSP